MLYTFLFGGLIVVIAVFLLLLLRSRKIKEKYVWLWLGLDFLALILLVLPLDIVDTLSKYLGFVYGSSMVFSIVIVVLIFTAIQQAVSISRLEEERRVLVEEVAILNARVLELESRVCDCASDR